MTSLIPLTRRRLLGTAAAAFGLGAYGLRPALARTTDVALQLSWLHSVQFAGSYIAKQKGYWADQRLNVSLNTGGPNAPVEPPVVAGTALMGISAADYASAAVAQGAAFKIVAVAMKTNPFAIASLPANPVRTPADLVGKRIGMAVANTPVLRALCALNGVDIAAIEIVPTQYDAAPLVNGQVDCLLCWATDLPVAMAIQGIDSITMLMADYGYALHSQAYIVTEGSIKDRRSEIVALLRGEVQGWKDYSDGTDAAAALTVAMFPDAGLDLATQQEQARRLRPLMFPDGDETRFGWFTDESVAANIETLALLDRGTNADLWDRSLLEEAYAG